MSNFRYTLDKSSRKFNCPACGKKRFVRFYDNEANEYVDSDCGRCDREVSCGYYKPYKSNASTPINYGGYFQHTKRNQSNNNIYIPEEDFSSCLKNYSNAPFFQNLKKDGFADIDIEEAIKLYGLGTYNYLNQYATTFPYINYNGQITFIQVKAFDSNNHGIGNPNSLVALESIKGRKDKWIEDYQNQEKKIRCFFGEHLLKRFPDNPIALVEAPKTAVYCSLYFGLPKTKKDFIWMAVYSKSSFSVDKLKYFINRKVELFPDLSKDGSTFREWETKANKFQKEIKGIKFKLNTFLEDNASQELKDTGGDMADFITMNI